MAMTAHGRAATAHGRHGTAEKKYFEGVARVNIRVHVRPRDGTSDLR